MKLPRRPVACVTDGETGIINAMSVVPNLVDIRCWNHILQDCGRWLTDKGCLKKEINCYKDHLRCIFGKESRDKSLEAINQLQEAWLDDFKKYFNDRISPSLTKVCKWAIDKITRFDPYSGITQNQSESMNKLLKSLNKWKEAPVDVIILSFLRLHQYYVKEISRGRAGLGNYNLRPQYISAKIDLSEIVQFAVCKPLDIVNAIRENQFIATPVQEESKKADDPPQVNIHMSRADELIKNDRIVFSPKLGTFTTKGTDDQPRVVTLFPEKCSCSIKSCYHILAVKKSLGMEVNEKTTPNLSVLSAADKKRKAGRKRPRPGDFDYILEEEEQSNMMTEEPTKMSNKFSEKFVTMRRKPVTDETSRKPVTGETSRKPVTGDNVTENTIRKPVTTTHDPAGPDWLQIGSITLKDEEKSILYLPNAWLNDRIIDATQEMLKRQFPHIWSLDTCLKASNLSFKKARGNFIQVLNRDPQKGGSHWLTLSTMKMKSLNEIKIFDSAFTSMSFPTQEVVCQLLRDGPPKIAGIFFCWWCKVFGIPQSILHLSNARRRPLCHLRQVQYMVSPFL